MKGNSCSTFFVCFLCVCVLIAKLATNLSSELTVGMSYRKNYLHLFIWILKKLNSGCLLLIYFWDQVIIIGKECCNIYSINIWIQLHSDSSYRLDCVMVHLLPIKSVSPVSQICLPGGNVLGCTTFIQRFLVCLF